MLGSLAAILLPLWLAIPHRIVVGPGETTPTLTSALRLARPGDTIIVRPGAYREPRLVVTVPLTILGDPGAILDGSGSHEVITVRADSVTIRGLTIRNVGYSYTEDRAGIRLERVRDCLIADNTLLDTFFGIYAERSSHCTVSGNLIVGTRRSQTSSGNAIHLFYSDRFTIAGNRIRSHRDGVYLEFSRGAEIVDNDSRANARYGLHFMFSDSCTYRRNTFAANASGVAVMYSRWVVMTDNRFENNWGMAAYGLLLKEIKDSRVTDNLIAGNTVGLFIEGSDRIVVERNQLLRNGWAMRLLANATGNEFYRNRFAGNTFDVSTNSQASSPSVFRENYWDAYGGYDLDRDGYGDVPFRPVRLFSLLVEQSKPSLILLHSFFLDLLEVAERVAPVLTPEALVDTRPLMRWHARS
ncbi:MAG TPA: nitrous oxide reductase family maturation protein NosD [Gemmatimonadales bacterium]|jgi:nitrous oxidase accessory protein